MVPAEVKNVHSLQKYTQNNKEKWIVRKGCYQILYHNFVPNENYSAIKNADVTSNKRACAMKSN